jgi:hypothetical protein
VQVRHQQGAKLGGGGGLRAGPGQMF